MQLPVPLSASTRLFKVFGETVTEIASRAQISTIESQAGILTLHVDGQEPIVVNVLKEWNS